MSAELLPVAQQQLPAQAIAQPSALLDAIARAAADPATDMDKMERLFAMHQTMVKQDAETAFNAAMSRAQAKMQPVLKNKDNTQTASKYADLAVIVDAIKPIYTDEGFSISFDTAEAPRENYLRVIAIVAHKGGHSRQYHLDLPPDETGAKGTVNKTRVHATGSTNTYARRYLICMAFNVQTFDDKDGNTGKKMLPDSQMADFKAAIEALTTEDEARNLWKSISEACTKAGDVPANEELKALIMKKRKGLAK